MQANAMYYFDYAISVQKYNPKLYLGTPQVLGTGWIIDRQTGINYPSIWPLNVSQKGEANRFNNERFMYFQTLTYIYIFFYNVLIEGKQ